MKTPFDLISQILSSRERYQLEPDDAFNPFIVQRGLSMSSPLACALLNETTNLLYDALDEQMMCDLMILLVPKTNGYHKWIKKDGKTDKKDTTHAQIQELAISMECSIDTIKLMIDLDPNFLDQYKDKNTSIREKKK